MSARAPLAALLVAVAIPLAGCGCPSYGTGAAWTEPGAYAQLKAANASRTGSGAGFDLAHPALAGLDDPRLAEMAWAPAAGRVVTLRYDAYGHIVTVDGAGNAPEVAALLESFLRNATGAAPAEIRRLVADARADVDATGDASYVRVTTEASVNATEVLRRRAGDGPFPIDRGAPRIVAGAWTFELTLETRSLRTPAGATVTVTQADRASYSIAGDRDEAAVREDARAALASVGVASPTFSGWTFDPWC